MSAEDCPRLLQPLRPTAAQHDVPWGNGDGFPNTVRPDNMVATAHIFACVAASVPACMTLLDLLGWRAPVQFDAGLQQCLVPNVQKTVSLGGSAGDGVALQINLQALGVLFLHRLQPVNVLHPHLRGPMEFHIGVLLAKHFARNDLHEVGLAAFLHGCGINFAGNPASSNPWVRPQPEDPNIAKKKPRSDQVVHLHAAWGERVSPMFQAFTQTFRLVHYVCPFMLLKKRHCSGSLQLAGTGTVCDCWHAFSQDHGNALKFHALDYVGLLDNAKGTWSRFDGTPADESRLSATGFYHEVRRSCDLTRLHSEQFHSDPRQHLQLLRFMPRLYPDGQAAALQASGVISLHDISWRRAPKL